MLNITDLGPNKENRGFVIDWFEIRLDMKLQNEDFQNEKDFFQKILSGDGCLPDNMSLYGKTNYVQQRCLRVIQRYVICGH